MNNGYEEVKKIVGNGNIIAEKVIEILNNQYPDKIIDYGMVLCILGLYGEKLESYFLKCGQNFDGITNALDFYLNMSKSKGKVLKK